MTTESTQAPAPATESTDAGAAAPESSTEGLPTEGEQAPAESEGKTTEQKTEVKAPESYTFVMPEGVELDEKSAGEFSAVAKELDLTQEQAQRVVDLYAKNVQGQLEAHKATVEGWVTAVKADKEIGGDKVTETVATARKAVEAFGSPELKALLDTTGLGNHPEFVRMMFRAGKAISEDRLVVGGEGGAVNTDIATTLYPNQK